MTRPNTNTANGFVVIETKGEVSARQHFADPLAPPLTFDPHRIRDHQYFNEHRDAITAAFYNGTLHDALNN